MSFEELIQEHTRALNENTKALQAHTRALNMGSKTVEVEHTMDSACKFCGITYKTLKNNIESGLLVPLRKPKGKREYFKETDLVALCESQHLFDGEYGKMRGNPRSQYYQN